MKKILIGASLGLLSTFLWGLITSLLSISKYNPDFVNEKGLIQILIREYLGWGVLFLPLSAISGIFLAYFIAKKNRSFLTLLLLGFFTPIFTFIITTWIYIIPSLITMKNGGYAAHQGSILLFPFIIGPISGLTATPFWLLLVWFLHQLLKPRID